MLRLKFLCLSTFTLVFSCSFTNGAQIAWKNHVKISSESHSDLERIPSELLSSLNLDVDEEKFERLHNLAKSEPEVGQEYQDLQLQEYDYNFDYRVKHSNNKEAKKRLAEEKQDYVATNNAFLNGSVTEYDYNAEEFKKEYESVIVKEPDIPSPPNPGNISMAKSDDDRPFQINEKVEEANTCMTLLIWQYLYRGTSCIWDEIIQLNGKGKIINIIIIFQKSALMWSLIYVVVAITMWCYKGMCCCCLTFDILHPYKAMKRIKNEAIFNPPGVERLPDGSTINYKPTSAEVRAYDNLLDSIYS